MSLHAQAFIPTTDPSGYGERIARDLRGSFTTEWAAEAGRVTAPDAVCEMHSWPDGLRLDAFSETDAALTAIEGLITAAVERAAPGERPAVEWYRRPTAS